MMNFWNVFDSLDHLSMRRMLRYALASFTTWITISQGGKPKHLIVDTDLFSDVDDTSALLLASTLPRANLLAVHVNVISTYSALATSAILAHYGNGFVPVGLRGPHANSSFFDTWEYGRGEYASKVAYHWSGGLVPWFEVEKAWEPVRLYRKTLAEAKDRSVTIASIGFLENLSGLLNSTADEYSRLDGYALVKTKVAELVVMGGGYPTGYEFNFWGDNPLATAHVVNTWPDSIPVTFLGAEVGEVVKTGAKLTVEGPENDPVKAAYQWYVGYNTTRESWDPLTMVYACEGLGTWFEFGNEHGYNFVWPNGSNIWINDTARSNQHYLRLKMDNETVAQELDQLYLKGARMYEDRTISKT